MYVYMLLENYYVVGFFLPSGDFCEDSRYKTANEARKQVNYLNGGNSDISVTVYKPTF